MNPKSLNPPARVAEAGEVVLDAVVPVDQRGGTRQPDGAVGGDQAAAGGGGHHLGDQGGRGHGQGAQGSDHVFDLLAPGWGLGS